MRFLRHTTALLLYYRLFRQVLPSVVVLRKPHIRLLLFGTTAAGSGIVAGQQQTDDSESVCRDSVSLFEKIGKMSTIKDQHTEKSPLIHSSDKLLLYYDCFSFYSQKVVMALHEKHLPFDSRIVNLFKNEQYQSWFLKLNTKGEVPVLQDAVRIIPDSARIIDYLEDNFSNGETPRLIPLDEGPEIRQKVNSFRQLLEEIPAGKLTTGAVLHSDLLKNARVPFIGPVRKALANAERDGKRQLQEYAQKNPEAREDLLRKAVRREETYNYLCSIDNFNKLLNDIDEILTKVENELSQHINDKADWWLCSKSFSIADIELTILLERLSQIGLEYRFWINKRPHLERYYERVKERDSYKKTIPNKFFFFKTLLITQAPLLISVVTAVAIIVGGAIIAKKYIL